MLSPLSITQNGRSSTLWFDRPESGNTITEALVEDAHAALDRAEEAGCTAIILRGSQTVFCTGADFGGGDPVDPERLYHLWERLALGPFVSLSVVEGQATAGGIGFVAASDMVLAGPDARFTLPELLFGLHPACVLPFLTRRIGAHAASYLTLSTQSINAEQALSLHLVDSILPEIELGLAQHIRRIERLDPQAIRRFKAYRADLDKSLGQSRDKAIAENRSLFGDSSIRANLQRYATEQKFPWEL
ncbi:enoyl-CoA hydratase/isomerase [Labrenzia sp. PHM005]|uniref:enoyl-CoA hydratase/isomerase n=1 Tax=Labrenzia sp. PHM005 TaxID=2590016 RepID=UPI001140460C|nr:enoyl-CoA hydratase/isomerase [Labrenzia sp. PHM005]QDG75031.1 enoyl-CoA hydratase/isomerase [Labrenzia sp. PHM005]